MTAAHATPERLGTSLLLSRAVTPAPRRDLFGTLGDDRDAVCQACGEAEHDGRVARPRGAEGMTPGIRAGAPRWDGDLEGWLRP